MANALTRWPRTEGLFQTRSMDRLFNEALRDWFGQWASPEEVGDQIWHPTVDIKETDEELTLMVDLPGLEKKDVQLSLENNVLTIKGERRFEHEEKENFYRLERAYGVFSRTFTLPRNVKADAVDASFKNGVLTVSLPKVEEARPKQIEIK